MNNESSAPVANRVRVCVSDISPSAEFQVRRKLKSPAIAEYAIAMRQGTALPPLKLAVIGGALVCLGGAHRISAAKRAGLVEIEADVYEGLTDAQSVTIALQDNLTHGVKLEKADRRNALRLYVRAGLHKAGMGRVKASRQIAQELGGAVSHTTVVTWMAQDHPAVYARMAKDTRRPPSGEFNAAKHRAELAYSAALGAAQSAVAAARGAGSAVRRGQIREALLGAAAEVAALGPYRVPPPEPVRLDF